MKITIDREVLKQAIDALEYTGGYRGPVVSAAIAALREALAQPQQEIAHWQPVETAPKDGSMLLICLPRQMNLVVRAWYNKIHNFWQTDYEGEGGITRPYYFHEGDLWHPIPSLPAVKAAHGIKESK